MQVLSFLGLVAYSLLRRDLRQDEDGKETLSQNLLQVNFWGTGLLRLALPSV